MSQARYFYEDSDAVRSGTLSRALGGREHQQGGPYYRFRTGAEGDDPPQTHLEHAAVVDAVVRRRVRGGFREPVMVREYDLRDDIVRSSTA